MELKIRVDDYIGSRARKLAEDLDLSLNRYVTDLIEQDLNRHGADAYADLWYERTSADRATDTTNEEQQ